MFQRKERYTFGSQTHKAELVHHHQHPSCATVYCRFSSGTAGWVWPYGLIENISIFNNSVATLIKEKKRATREVRMRSVTVLSQSIKTGFKNSLALCVTQNNRVGEQQLTNVSMTVLFQFDMVDATSSYISLVFTYQGRENSTLSFTGLYTKR